MCYVVCVETVMRYLFLFLCVFWCRLLWAAETKVFYLADFEKNSLEHEEADDYFLGKFIYSPATGEMSFIPVETSDDIAQNVLMLKLQHRKMPRLRMEQVRKDMDKLIQGYKFYGFDDYVGDKFRTFKPGSRGFEKVLAYQLSSVYAVIDPVVGEHYFGNGLSKSLGKELRMARQYFHPLYPHRPVSLGEYAKIREYLNLSLQHD